MTIDMAAVRSQLAKNGIAVATGTLAQVERSILAENRFTTAAKRSTRKLRPYTIEDAPPRSLSAVYGLGAQPLHTDGAHLLDPPDVIVLHSALPTPIGTAVHQPGFTGSFTLIPEAVREGIFTVRGNGVSFLASAVENRSNFRFDPVVMSPADAMARAAVDWFAAERTKATVHQWDRENQLLFIDNRRMLHAREAVTGYTESRELSRLALNYAEGA